MYSPGSKFTSVSLSKNKLLAPICLCIAAFLPETFLRAVNKNKRIYSDKSQWELTSNGPTKSHTRRGKTQV